MSDEKQVDPHVANASSGSSLNEFAVISGRAADETLDLIEKHGHEVGELASEKKKKLKRKIYVHVLLLVTFIDFMLYLWKTGGPRYYPAWIVQTVASFTLTSTLFQTIRFILSKRNKERRQWIVEQAALGHHGEGYVEQVVGDETVKVKVDVSMLDLTDLENKYFIYPL